MKFTAIAIAAVIACVVEGAPSPISSPVITEYDQYQYVATSNNGDGLKFTYAIDNVRFRYKAVYSQMDSNGTYQYLFAGLTNGFKKPSDTSNFRFRSYDQELNCVSYQAYTGQGWTANYQGTEVYKGSVVYRYLINEFLPDRYEYLIDVFSGKFVATFRQRDGQSFIASFDITEFEFNAPAIEFQTPFNTTCTPAVESASTEETILKQNKNDLAKLEKIAKKNKN